MSGKSRAVAVATVVAAGAVALWAGPVLASTGPTVLGSTTKGPEGSNGGLVNGGLVNLYLGSNNTAIGNTCNNVSDKAPVAGNILSWALYIPHNSCVFAGGPNHF